MRLFEILFSVRFFGICVFLFGLLPAYVYPLMFPGTYGYYFTFLSSYRPDKDGRWISKQVDLEVTDTPALLEITGDVPERDSNLENRMFLTVKISSPRGVVIDEPVRLIRNSRKTQHTFEDKPFGRSSIFTISKSGKYTVDIRQKDNADFGPNGLSGLKVSVKIKVGTPDTQYREMGYMFMLIGFAIATISRRKEDPDIVEEASKQSEKKKIKWGRDTDAD